MYSCVHTHSTFCDGKNTLEQMADSAFAQGIKVFGFSGHSYVPVDNFGISTEKFAEYYAEAKRVQQKYKGKMDVMIGLEMDDAMPSDLPLNKLDYVIGSSHSTVGLDRVCYPIDGSPEALHRAVENGFNNDFKILVQRYYEQYLAFEKKYHPDIIGHFDLLCKYNSKGEFFDENSSWYKDMSLDYLDEFLKLNIVFEMNTGAISRGYLSRPYPDSFLLKRILEKQGRVIITTDTHSADTLQAYYKESEDILRNLGFKSVCELTPNGFIERNL